MDTKIEVGDYVRIVDMKYQSPHHKNIMMVRQVLSDDNTGKKYYYLFDLTRPGDSKSDLYSKQSIEKISEADATQELLENGMFCYTYSSHPWTLCTMLMTYLDMHKHQFMSDVEFKKVAEYISEQLQKYDELEKKFRIDLERYLQKKAEEN